MCHWFESEVWHHHGSKPVSDMSAVMLTSLVLPEFLEFSRFQNEIRWHVVECQLRATGTGPSPGCAVPAQPSVHAVPPVQPELVHKFRAASYCVYVLVIVYYTQGHCTMLLCSWSYHYAPPQKKHKKCIFLILCMHVSIKYTSNRLHMCVFPIWNYLLLVHDPITKVSIS